MTAGTLLGVQLGINGYGPFGRQPEYDLPEVLAVVRDTGYDGAEIMTDTLSSGAGPVRTAFEASGLRLAALHVFLEEISEPAQAEACLDTLQSLGCPRLIVTATVEESAVFFEGLAARLNQLGARCIERGVALYYHPHDAEYHQVEGVRGTDRLSSTTEPELVRFNIDTYWAYRGGADPAEVITQFAQRCDYYHIKDGDGTGNLPLGRGEVGIDQCLKSVMDSGSQPDWLVYEDAHPRLPARELCTLARRHLQEHGFG